MALYTNRANRREMHLTILLRFSLIMRGGLDISKAKGMCFFLIELSALLISLFCSASYMIVVSSMYVKGHTIGLELGGQC